MRLRTGVRSLAVLVVVLGAGLAPLGAAGAGEMHSAKSKVSTFRGLGLELRPRTPLAKLHHAPPGLKHFIRKQQHSLLLDLPASLRSKCANAPTVIVKRVRSDGWAYISDFGLFGGHGAPYTCSRGGAWVLWRSNASGAWRGVTGGQETPSCGLLRRRHVPRDVWTFDCYRKSRAYPQGHVVAYGWGPGQAHPACTGKRLFKAAVRAEGFNPHDPSYGPGGVGKPTAFDPVCYDGWAVASVNRPDVGTTDGATLFDLKWGSWQEDAVIGAAMPCTLKAEGVSKADRKRIDYGNSNSPAFCG